MSVGRSCRQTRVEAGTFNPWGFPEAGTVRIEQEETEETGLAARKADLMCGRRRRRRMAQPLGRSQDLRKVFAALRSLRDLLFK